MAGLWENTILMSDKKYFAHVSAKVSFPEIEDRVISYWKKHKTFEKSVERRSKNKTWTFLDGPPFITGLPHYGSLLSSIPKDVFPFPITEFLKLNSTGICDM